MEQLRKQLIGELIGLARATDGNEHLINPSATAVIIESLAAQEVDATELEQLRGRVEAEKRKMVPDCFLCAAPCGRTSAYDLDLLQQAEEPVHKLKLRLLDALTRLAVSNQSKAHEGLYYTGLIVLGLEDFDTEQLQSIVQEAEKAAV